MATTINGVSVPTTRLEKIARAKAPTLRAVKNMRAGKRLTNKHEMLVIGTALNRMSDSKKRAFMAHMTGTWNRTIWRNLENSAKLHDCRLFAQRVCNRAKLIQKGNASLSGAPQAVIDAQNWLLSKVNSC